jgi:hypothetical protein
MRVGEERKPPNVSLRCSGVWHTAVARDPPHRGATDAWCVFLPPILYVRYSLVFLALQESFSPASLESRCIRRRTRVWRVWAYCCCGGNNVHGSQLIALLCLATLFVPSSNSRKLKFIIRRSLSESHSVGDKPQIVSRKYYSSKWFFKFQVVPNIDCSPNWKCCEWSDEFWRIVTYGPCQGMTFVSWCVMYVRDPAGSTWNRTGGHVPATGDTAKLIFQVLCPTCPLLIWLVISYTIHNIYFTQYYIWDLWDLPSKFKALTRLCVYYNIQFFSFGLEPS